MIATVYWIKEVPTGAAEKKNRDGKKKRKQGKNEQINSNGIRIVRKHT